MFGSVATLQLRVICDESDPLRRSAPEVTPAESRADDDAGTRQGMLPTPLAPILLAVSLGDASPAGTRRELVAVILRALQALRAGFQ